MLLFRSLTFIFLLVVLSSCSKERPQEKLPIETKQPIPEKLFFADYSNLFSTNFDGSGVELLFKGFDPSISPDGKTIAYTEYYEGPKKPGKIPELDARQIAIYDIATKKRTILTHVPKEQNHSAVFSPDGKELLFNHYAGNGWHIACVDIGGKSVRILAKSTRELTGLYCPEWATDGTSFVCHNLDTLFEYSRDGKLLTFYPMNQIVSDEVYGISSASRIYSDPKHGRFFVEAGSDEEDGPELEHYGIFIYDKKAKTSKRISPDSLHASAPIWIESRNKFYFQGYTGKDLAKARKKEEWGLPPMKIYSMNDDGSDVKLLVTLDSATQNFHTYRP